MRFALWFARAARGNGGGSCWKSPISEPDLVVVGLVGKPHGLDGSFVVERPSEDPKRFDPGVVLLAGGKEVCVVARKRSGGRLVVRLDSPVPRGTALEVAREDLPEPEPGSYYVFQLVGLEVEEEGGRRLGEVVDVVPGPANDALELASGLLLPLVEACVRQVDLEGRRILIAQGFVPDDPRRRLGGADKEGRPGSAGSAE